MTPIELIIKQHTDEKGYVDISSVCVRFANKRSNFMLDAIMKHIRDNKIPYKIFDPNPVETDSFIKEFINNSKQ